MISLSRIETLLFMEIDCEVGCGKEVLMESGWRNGCVKQWVHE